MSTTFFIDFRDGNTQEVTGQSLTVSDGTIQVIRGNGTTVAAFPSAGISGVYPVENPVAQKIVYTARDYAINHGIVPLIEELGLNLDADSILVDQVADDVLVAEGDGLRIGSNDAAFARAVAKATAKAEA